MPSPHPSPTANPFRADIVSDPRRIESSIAGPNDTHLNYLIHTLRRLAAGDPPRLNRLPHAQLILSPEAGFGKSHLIGRLFTALENEAFLVYLRPFRNWSLCWKSALHRVVKELTFMRDSFDPSSTQLHAFAMDVFRNLSGDRDLSVRSLRDRISDLRPIFQSALGLSPVRPDGAASAWLTVLYHYAAAGDDADTREICLSWLSGESIDPEDGAKIGLKRAHIQGYDLSVEETNERCRSLVMDLCRLAGLSRPFVLCFDQTEFYGDEPRLAATFGALICELVDAAPNQMTLVTANIDPWDRAIKPHFHVAYQHRFLHPPLQMEGIAKSQARDLISLRLTHVPEAGRFVDEAWLDGQFSQNPVRGVRDFLRACRERWDSLVHAEPEATPSVEDFYHDRCKDILANPARLVFDPDILLWLVRTAPRGMPDIMIEDYASPKGHLCVKWKTPRRDVYFGIEAGSHWRRWHSILATISSLRADSRKKGTEAIFVFLRTAEQKAIPGRWQIAGDINAARGEFLCICTPDLVEVARLYAAHDLCADAAQGNIPFTADETLHFVRAQLSQWWQALMEPQFLRDAAHPEMRTPLLKAHMTVTELVSACLGELHASAGEEDGEVRHRSVRSQSQGALFHEAAHRFIRWLASEENEAASAGLIDGNQLFQALCRIQKVRHAFVRRALTFLCRRLAHLRGSAPDFTRWSDIIVSSEHSLTDIPLELEGLTIFVSGRIDLIRSHRTFSCEIVEYKLSRGEDYLRNLIQIAIYHVLMTKSAPALCCCGTIEYYGPHLKAVTEPPEFLRHVFDRYVLPVLQCHAQGMAPEPPPAGSDRAVTPPRSGCLTALPPPLPLGAPAPALPHDATRPRPAPVPLAEEDLSGRIASCFRAFDCPVEVIGRLEAPQIVRYKVRPQEGVKVVSLANRAADLQVALALAHAPIIEPSRGYVTIDIPRSLPLPVSLEDVTGRPEYRSHGSLLAYPVGMGTEGQAVMADFADPGSAHALVAGASGSGKSEFLKSLFLSLSARNTPGDLRFFLIDPKLLTFADMTGSPFLGAPLITDVASAVECLSAEASEMDDRYSRLARGGFQDIAALRASGSGDMPWHIIICDEFADLVLGGKEEKKRFERIVSRIAAKGRAAGIHLVLATQRPDSTVVTGLIKANLSLKVCFKVNTWQNSEIILGRRGGELLLGRGDLLCDTGREVVRAQAPFAGPLKAS